MVVRKVVPRNLTYNAVREMAAYIGADLADSARWYGGAPELDGIVPLASRSASDYWRGPPGKVDPEPEPGALAVSSELAKLIGLLPW